MSGPKKKRMETTDTYDFLGPLTHCYNSGYWTLKKLPVILTNAFTQVCHGKNDKYKYLQPHELRMIENEAQDTILLALHEILP